jgi:hypothetical protein
LDDHSFHHLPHSCDTFFNCLCHQKTLEASPPKASDSTAEGPLAFYPNFTQKLMLSLCTKNWSLMSATWDIETHFIST